jgi:Tfp pilus assembly protein PilX
MSPVSGGEPLHPMTTFGPTDDPGGGEPTELRHHSFSADPDTLPQPRHHEPAPHLSKRAGDDFAWLYRQDTSNSGIASGDPRTLLLPLDAHPSYPSSYPLVPAPPHPSSRGRNPAIIMIVILLCLTIGAVAGMALLLQSDWRISAPGSGESSAQQAASSDAPHSGQVAILTPTEVTVGCQAPQSTDGAGAPVSYAPEQMSDGKMNTAWRCNGNGVGQVVTFGFPAETTIAQVGLVNGYAKVDPASGTQRYGEYRRITKVTWTFANGTSFQQLLHDGVETVQKLSIPAQSGGPVTLTIEASTEAGSTARGRDAVLISEVVFGGSA